MENSLVTKISLASDHAGFEQKQQLVDYLARKGFWVIDRGPDTDDRVDYPDFAVAVAKDVQSGLVDRGILVCGTGIGMALAANIVREDFAVLCREHNNANVLTLSGRFVSIEENERIVDAFLATEFAGGRHADRVAKINALD